MSHHRVSYLEELQAQIDLIESERSDPPDTDSFRQAGADWQEWARTVSNRRLRIVTIRQEMLDCPELLAQPGWAVSAVHGAYDYALLMLREWNEASKEAGVDLDHA